MFTGFINQSDDISLLRYSDIDILSNLDTSFCAHDKDSSITPGTQAIRSEPVNTEPAGRTVVCEQCSFAEVIKMRLVFIGIIRYSTV